MPRGLLQKAADSVIEANFELASLGGEIADAGHAADFQVVGPGLQDVEIFVGELEVEFAGIDRLTIEGKFETEAVAQPDDGWRIVGEGLVADESVAEAKGTERLGNSVLLDESMVKFARETSQEIPACHALTWPELSGREQ